VTERPIDRVHWVYSSTTNAEIAERYDAWAKDYDTDLEAGLGYTGPTIVSAYVAKHVANDSRVLDAGVGTGLVGVALARHGFDDLTGIDLSQGMLGKAAETGVYGELRQMTLGETLHFASETFDAVACVGTLTEGHAPPSSLDELIRVTRPGGYIVFSIRPDVYASLGFAEKIEALTTAGKWTLADSSDEVLVMPQGDSIATVRVWVYRVL